MQGRVTVYTGQPRTLQQTTYDVPDPEPGGIIVRMRGAGLCGSDLHIWRGDLGATPPTGRPLGHEGFGTIHALGDGVSTDFDGRPLAVGDRITWYSLYTCYRCRYCLTGNHDLCVQRLSLLRPSGGEYPYFLGTFSDYYYLPAHHPVFRIPDALVDAEVASLNCAMGTVFQGLLAADVRQGAQVVILGAGGLGLYGACFARGLGATTVISVDGQRSRLALARELGATATIDINELTTPAARIARVRELTDGHGADVIVELVASGEVVQEGIDMLAPGGAFVEIGNIVRGRTATIEPASLLRRKRLIGSSMFPPGIMPRLLDLLLELRATYSIHKVVSHRFALGQIDDAFAHADWKTGQVDVIRAVIVPEVA
jgi:threonine dehydrogenase-like Zn-dependent dehydrogenase